MINDMFRNELPIEIDFSLDMVHVHLKVFRNENNEYSTVSCTDEFKSIKGNGNTWHESVCDWLKSFKQGE